MQRDYPPHVAENLQMFRNARREAARMGKGMDEEIEDRVAASLCPPGLHKEDIKVVAPLFYLLRNALAQPRSAEEQAAFMLAIIQLRKEVAQYVGAMNARVQAAVDQEMSRQASERRKKFEASRMGRFLGVLKRWGAKFKLCAKPTIDIG